MAEARVNGQRVRFCDEQIEMSHGAGGKATRRLVEGLIAPLLDNEALEAVSLASGFEEAAIIGEITEKPAGAVLSRSSYGGTRIVDMLVGDPLPRIC